MRWAWVAVALAFGAGMWFRHAIWVEGQDARHWLRWYYQYIYYSSWCRFDELLAGVALAMLKHHHGAAWSWLMARGNALLVLGVGVTGAAFRWFLQDHYGHAPTVFGYPLLALGFSLLILAALAPGSLLHRLRVPGAASLALWSYAVYLTHRSVSELVAACLRDAGLGPDSVPTILACLAASLLAGWLLYRLVETPFMRLRERWVPGNRRRPQADGGAAIAGAAPRG